MDWMDRLLAGDELDGDERREFEEALARDRELRAFVERVREVERAPGPRGELPPLETLELSPADRADAEQSLRELLTRAGVAPRVLAPARRRPGWARLPAPAWGGVALALAASLLLFFASPSEHLVSGLTAEPVGRTRGTEGGTWQAGDAFRLAFTPESAGFGAVFHVDPAGAVELLLPESASAGAVPFREGQGVVLPAPETGERWELDGAGREVFLLAAWRNSPADLAEVLADLRTAAASARDAVDAVEAELARRADQVEKTSVDAAR
ncbi:MAG: DUF4384 domain-containing protein [Gemmatimonadetes bacterium]|nr:DUF4384 domain-containing protein [Gemmatimonadota bacterium]